MCHWVSETRILNDINAEEVSSRPCIVHRNNSSNMISFNCPYVWNISSSHLSPPPKKIWLIILGPILLPFLLREKCPSALISVASFKLLARKKEAYSPWFFFCLAPAAGTIRRALSLRATPHLISSRCSLISQSAGWALFCCHLSFPSRRSRRDEIEHENQMPCVRLALGCPSEGSP